MELNELFANLQQSVELGLIRPKEGANRAIDAICATDKTRKFTIDELRELLWEFRYLAAGLDELIRNNFR